MPDPTFRLLPAAPSQLLAATPGPDLAAHGYVEEEFRASGTVAASWGDYPAANFATRVVVRRPSAEAGFSGTVVIEWLNVSSGDDAAPDYTYLAEEIVRQGHAWVGVSAQFVGVEGGKATVGDVTGVAENGLRARLPERFGDLHHPGDAYCYGIFTAIANGLDANHGPLPGWLIRTRLAVGESQSAFALTTYVNDIQPDTLAFDGFLIHSRGGAALGHGEPGRGIDLDAVRHGLPVTIRTDTDVPVLMVVTETDVLSRRLDFLPARQDDTDRIRLWEIAGTAHADLWQIGEFESFLGCPDPVNRGQQAFVLRAGLRALIAWSQGGEAPPIADRLEVGSRPGERQSDRWFETDTLGNVLGGVRTPAVEAATQQLSGMAAEGSTIICALFGRTLAIDPELLLDSYGTVDGYLSAYTAATDAAIAAGFILAEDRDAVLAESRPDLLG